MVYSIKRYFSYRIKSLEIYFKTKKTQHEIAKAYKSEKGIKAIPVVAVTRPTLTKAGVWAGGICLVLLVVMFSGTIIKNVATFTDTVRNNLQRASENRKKKAKTTPVKEKVPAKMPSVDATIKKDSVAPPPEEEEFTRSRLHNHALPFPKEMLYCILANKAEKTMYVIRKKDNQWSLFRKYFMAIGEFEGRKLLAGDKRTPEGLYYIIGRKERSEMNKMYGPLAFVLNYPNEDDRKNGRSGNGIWIHGTNPDSVPVQTRGCLELDNRNISELGSYLQTGIGTPVLIISEKNVNNPVAVPDYDQMQAQRRTILSQYKFQRGFFIALLERWKNAWEAQDIEDYTNYYHTGRFFGQGMEWDAWKERKSRTFDMYDTIRVSLAKIFLAEFSESTAVLKFLQGYSSERMNVVNGKKLEFVKSDGKWKIYRENSLPNQELLL